MWAHLALTLLYIGYGVYEVVDPNEALELLNGYDKLAILESHPEWTYNESQPYFERLYDQQKQKGWITIITNGIVPFILELIALFLMEFSDMSIHIAE